MNLFELEKFLTMPAKEFFIPDFLFYKSFFRQSYGLLFQARFLRKEMPVPIT